MITCYLKYILIIFLFFISANIVYSQSEIEVRDTVKIEIDTNYIKRYPDQLTLKLFTITKSNKISLFDPLLNSTIQYSPNQKVNLGIGVIYKLIGFGFAFNLGGSKNNDNDIYGETKQFDMQINAYSRKFTFDTYLQNYTGYYLLDPQKYNSIWTDTLPFPQRPDIGTLALGFSGVYTLKYNKLSYKASFILNERQKKSAGSFLLGGYFSLLAIAGDSSLIPIEVKNNINPKNDIVASVAFNYGPAFGYIQTFIIHKHYFVTMSLILGISMQKINTYTVNPEYNVDKNAISGRTQARLAFGINKDKWFLGISAINDNYAFNNKNDNKDISRLNYEFGNVRFFYGRRFNVKKLKTEKDL